ncbi:MAG TPA: bifunctional (p)ppGpp synthetase/guanosine-3',5'-bis(diphosphate) 3'-pyrophosphohydrolase [Spirochaetales bacterium]|nr:bifunctional (p)ppGpp synthetase/guanosine-3',5'-bis(diphosphate) 3'-pyrophosphohydrolase [Spirochaetales bacterium]HOV37681.1 bifunctional (p)ppGpp synthetase/guanosine-3',5'-bis(diphosphate) 3'-pyrophosphohydrolase [Spirochaetales bacterium]
MVERVEQFEQKLSFYSEEEKAKILEAAYWAMELHQNQQRASGEPFFIHPLQVAEILVDLRMDAESVIAALLHDVLEDTEVRREELRERFGKEVEQLVNGVTKISALRAKSKSIQQAETIRKMLFAMVKDIRVILIKLADKLHNMRTLEFLPEAKRKAIAEECLDIYAPLATRLGIGWIKAELEDLSLKHLHRDVYDQIKAFVAAKKEQRGEYLAQMQERITEAARAEGIPVQVESRAKHFYSIFIKMKKRGKSLEEIYDLLGIRILCETQSDCYVLLGIVHRLWKPIEGRFKDYIAMPKANKYQSLHTTVMGDGGKLIEIQIRTEHMHQTAEHGIAAHWLYKKGTTTEVVRLEDLPIINRLKRWNGVRISSGEFLNEIKSEILKDSIYVFTPKGDVIELPKGSTPIDFAYHIHTDIGDHISAAKADGVIIPLKEELKNTQVVEILTSPQAHPHLAWLRYVRTARARSKIRSWLKKNDPSIIIDRHVVAKKKPDLHFPPSQPKREKPREEEGHREGGHTLGIRIGENRNMLINIAGCCNPVTGDEIVGYVSRGRGIIVHKKDCPNLKSIPDFQERSIEVEWETVSPKATRHFQVTARRTLDLFSEIEGAVRKYKGHLIAGRVDEDGPDRLIAHFIMELDRTADFGKVLKSIRTIPSILTIQDIPAETHSYDID